MWVLEGLAHTVDRRNGEGVVFEDSEPLVAGLFNGRLGDGVDDSPPGGIPVRELPVDQVLPADDLTELPTEVGLEDPDREVPAVGRLVDLLAGVPTGRPGLPGADLGPACTEADGNWETEAIPSLIATSMYCADSVPSSRERRPPTMAKAANSPHPYIGDRKAGNPWCLGLVRSRHLEETAHADVVQVVADLVRVRSILAEPTQRAADQFLVVVGQLVVGGAQALHNAGSDGLENHVSVREQPVEERLPAIRLRATVTLRLPRFPASKTAPVPSVVHGGISRA